MTAIWLSILKTLLTSLLAVLVISVTVFVLYWLLPRKNLYDILQKYKRSINTIFLLLIFLIPLAFSLFNGIQPFSGILVQYIGELIISVAIVVTFWATWTVLENPTLLKRALFVRLLRLLLKVKKGDSPIDDQAYSLYIDVLYFFTVEYWHLKSELDETTFKNCLNICQIGLRRSERDLVLYDCQNPSEERIISIEDHVNVYPFDDAWKRLFDISTEEKLALAYSRELSKIPVTHSDYW